MYKYVIVTGGTKGIGEEIVKNIIKFKRTKVIVCARNESSKQKKNSKIIFEKCDFSKIKQVKGLIKKIDSKYNKLFGLVNNVAYPAAGLFDGNLNDREINKAINVNIFSTLILSKFFISKIDKNYGGIIINLSGAGAGWNPGHEGKLLYYSNKVWMAGFTEALSIDCKKYNIQTYGISPNVANTELRMSILKKISKIDGNILSKGLETKFDSRDKCGKLVYLIFQKRPKHLSGKVLSPVWDKNTELFKSSNSKINKYFGLLRRIDFRNFKIS